MSFDMISLMSSFGILFYLVLIGLSVYCLVLFIRLAHRGIKALDIYINEKRDQNRY
ncbi:hypothetical protein [Paenibacillus ginsengarvi]|uniref:hypothetical protein n=1 Tax=Paenibacillus ginsengarvi TaxID=400777 RepID=UPI001456F26F|nr:hypothetical protein [Paenibacillus ginsengarvi]